MVNVAYNDDFFFLLRDMVIDDHFLFDMMMTVMMHYNGDEDHFFLCHRHWDLDNLLHLALKDALLRDHLWPLHNFLLLMWDVKVHNHFLLDMVMTMVVHDRWNMHNLFLCHRDWHFNYMLALSGQVGSGRVRSVRSGQVGSGRVRSGQFLPLPLPSSPFLLFNLCNWMKMYSASNHGRSSVRLRRRQQDSVAWIEGEPTHAIC